MTPGTIGILAQELSRFSSFSYSLDALKRPPGTKSVWSAGTPLANNVIAAQNWFCSETKGEWLWILGDDHTFGEDALLDLIAHDVDIVCPVNIMRAKPFHPLIFDERGKRMDWGFLDGKEGLVEVPACGNAGMLIKRRVLEAMGENWFEWAPKGSPYAGSDLAFCWKARQAGFKVYVDTDTVFGHTTLATFVPARLSNDGTFGAFMQVQGDLVAYFRFKANQGAVLFEQRGLMNADRIFYRR